MHLSTSQSLALVASIVSTILISPCHAYVNWLYPQSSARNLAYNYNDLVYFTWDSNFTDPSLTLWCASDNSYYTLYTANVTTNGTSPQNFPYTDAFNQSCHMSLYCHNSPDCGPVGQSAEFALSHNKAAAAQTWGIAATASIGKEAGPTATGITTSSSSSLATPAAKTASAPATATPGASSGGLSSGAKAGIGVGVAVGVIVVLAAVWFCATRARRRRRMRMEAGSGGLGASKGMSEQRYAGGLGWMGPARQEMDGEGRTNELQGTPQAELSSVASPAVR